jgi:hypothetical protein
MGSIFDSDGVAEEEEDENKERSQKEGTDDDCLLIGAILETHSSQL